jgi:hypothetical protein
MSVQKIISGICSVNEQILSQEVDAVMAIAKCGVSVVPNPMIQKTTLLVTEPVWRALKARIELEQEST